MRHGASIRGNRLAGQEEARERSAPDCATVERNVENEMTPDSFLDLLWKERALAIVRTAVEEVAAFAANAAIRGGFRIVEFTLNTPGALGLINEFSQKKDVVVGAGTVLKPEEARAAVAAGARFLASPVLDGLIIREALDLGVTVMPGTFTPTEMWQAYRAGAHVQKLFPAMGPAHVRSLQGPMPFLRVLPTSGVDADNAVGYLEAGAFAVGFVSSLFPPEDLRDARYERIERRARTLRERVEGCERGHRWGRS
jgi:Entner-Doudoroff aldolase